MNQPEIKIEKMTAVSQALLKMDVGDSFLTVVPKYSIYAAARSAAIKVAMRRQPDGSYRVWRKA